MRGSEVKINDVDLYRTHTTTCSKAVHATWDLVIDILKKVSRQNEIKISALTAEVDRLKKDEDANRASSDMLIATNRYPTKSLIITARTVTPFLVYSSMPKEEWTGTLLISPASPNSPC